MSKYIRKTMDVWYVLVNYGSGFEHECTEISRRAAIAQVRCYRENVPEYPVKFRKVRERIV
jgi:hypothetical protein